ncbi:hypothetical protein ElyMa_003267900 [Elysia marginata]|uniref:Uncharacterized protein n=1 Tax=Elysia marginata TaxID=1093978 RepID=A0AAV4JCE8_9GAST|nr:hypothetical protein ElyMa_003267900 [Elysia marginata]
MSGDPGGGRDSADEDVEFFLMFMSIRRVAGGHAQRFADLVPQGYLGDQLGGRQAGHKVGGALAPVLSQGTPNGARCSKKGGGIRDVRNPELLIQIEDVEKRLTQLDDAQAQIETIIPIEDQDLE